MMKKGFFYFKTTSYLLILLLLGACSNKENESKEPATDPKIELEKSKLELEKQKLEIEKEKIEQEKSELSEKIETDETIKLVKKAQSFNINSMGIVTSTKAYFYNNPDFGTKRNAYLVKGDIVEALKVSNTFVYISFYSEYLDKTSKGWVNVKDIEHFDEFGQGE